MADDIAMCAAGWARGNARRFRFACETARFMSETGRKPGAAEIALRTGVAYSTAARWRRSWIAALAGAMRLGGTRPARGTEPPA